MTKYDSKAYLIYKILNAIHIYMYTYVYADINVHAYIYIYIHIFMYIHVYVCIEYGTTIFAIVDAPAVH